MKNALFAAIAMLCLTVSAYAQTGPVGQDASGAISVNAFTANTDTVGFGPTSLTAAGVAGAGTTQATAALITTKTTKITSCSGTTGFVLPAVNRYEAILLMNRSGGSCLIWPSIGATVETALGTNGATNAPFTMLTNTDVTFRPVSPTQWLQ